MMVIRLAIATFIVALLTAPAVAGFVDSPLPLLGGQKTKHVFSVPGVTSDVGNLGSSSRSAGRCPGPGHPDYSTTLRFQCFGFSGRAPSHPHLAFSSAVAGAMRRVILDPCAG